MSAPTVTRKRLLTEAMAAVPPMEQPEKTGELPAQKQLFPPVFAEQKELSEAEERQHLLRLYRLHVEPAATAATAEEEPALAGMHECTIPTANQMNRPSRILAFRPTP